jgi:hypothetical protein
MTTATECHPNYLAVINGPKPDSPAGIVYRAADLLEARARKLDRTPPWTVQPEGADGVEVVSDDNSMLIAEIGPLDDPTTAHVADFIAALDPEFALLAAEAWEHQGDDMGDYGAHFHLAPVGPVVVDSHGEYRTDWTATVRAALKYLRETAPVVEAVDAHA